MNVFSNKTNKESIYIRFLKRYMDLILSLIAILVLSPLLIIIGIVVRVTIGSPVLFCQKRPGLNEKIFTMYKFRTMTEKKDENGEILPDADRLTNVGRFLRTTSIDELPELLNIIKGDMCIVGPRPQLVRDMIFMTADQRKRHFVRPGLTGLAQVNGRNNITWEEKLSLDQEYIENISFLLDWKIIFLTIKKVIRRDDISTIGMETAEDYGDYLIRTGKITSAQYLKGKTEANEMLKREGKKKDEQSTQ
jgi:lipopolysaccharide/colanic/teichoic acid biosynthesis glycosyltransferase